MALPGSGTTGLRVRFRALERGIASRFNSDALDRELKAYMRKFSADLIDRVRVYPPQRGTVVTSRRDPTQSFVNPVEYERTFTLYNSWRRSVKDTPSQYRIIIKNDTDHGPNSGGRKYAIYVQGKWQTPQHSDTGWINIATDEKVLDRAGFRRGLQAIVNRHMRGGI